VLSFFPSPPNWDSPTGLPPPPHAGEYPLPPSLVLFNHSIPRLISFAKNGSNQRSIVSVYGPSQLYFYEFRV